MLPHSSEVAFSSACKKVTFMHGTANHLPTKLSSCIRHNYSSRYHSLVLLPSVTASIRCCSSLALFLHAVSFLMCISPATKNFECSLRTQLIWCLVSDWIRGWKDISKEPLVSRYHDGCLCPHCSEPVSRWVCPECPVWKHRHCSPYRLRAIGFQKTTKTNTLW